MAKNNESTALAVLEQHNFELVPLSPETQEIIIEEMDGLGGVPIEVIKIPAGGGLSFELPGGNDDTPIAATEIEGIIVDQHPVNTLWLQEYDGSSRQPDCASLDGKVGTNTNGEKTKCADCPYNQFGTARNGRGKACKNTHRVYILMSGQVLPMLLSLPPSSLPAWKKYLGRKIVIRGKRPWMVLTKVTLKKERNEGGIAYSQAVFTKVDDLSPAECEALKPTVEGFKRFARSEAMNRTDIEEAVAVESTEAENAGAFEHVPF